MIFSWQYGNLLTIIHTTLFFSYFKFKLFLNLENILSYNIPKNMILGNVMWFCESNSLNSYKIRIYSSRV